MDKKLVLITGASSGIGKACAEQYAKDGHDLIVTARRADRIEALKNELQEKHNVKVHAYVFDVRIREASDMLAKDLIDNNLTPDIFINNAGLARGLEPIHEGDIDKWDEMIDTNVKGFLYVARAILPLMVKVNKGHVINIGSIAGSQVYPNGNVYNATKFAVRALSQAMNMDLVNTNLRISSIEPGAVETEFSLVRFDKDEDKASSVYDGFKPLCADDIADIIKYTTYLPEHINIQNILVTPTAQRSSGAGMVKRH